MESWLMGLRYAARRLRTRPTYAALAVATLALGIGGTAAMFSLVKGLLLNPLPYRDEARVAVFWRPFDWSEREFLYLRGRVPGFGPVAAYALQDVTIEEGGGPARLLPGIASSAGLFDVLGAPPLLGRGFREGDDRPGAEPVAVLSYDAWQEMGGRASVLGRRLLVAGTPTTVVGVMPRGFWFPNPSVRIWTARAMHEDAASGELALVGRLAPGFRMEAMSPQLAATARLLGSAFTYPAQWDKTRDPSLTPIRTYLLGSMRPALLATLAGMALLLLIACVNVAALMLAQVNGRATQFAVCAALGASRRRLVQQVACEALLVGALAAAAGAALAAAGLRPLAAALPLAGWEGRATLGWSLVGGATAAALAAAAAVALLPALTLWRGDLAGALSRSRTSGVGGRGGALESGLVVAEVALAVVMAAGAALLIRSVMNLYAVQPGIRTQGVAVIDLTLPAGMSQPDRLRSLNDLLREIPLEPGVDEMGVSHKLPLRGQGSSFDISVPGRPDLDGTTTFFRIVSRDYLGTLGVRVRRGRGFDGTDRPGGHAVVVNHALAARYFAGTDPVGRTVGGGFGGGTVVGVVDDVAEAGLTDRPAPVQYLLADQVPDTYESQSLVVRMRPGLDPAAALPGLRRAVQRVAPRAAVQQATTMDGVLARAVGPARQVMALLTLIAALALVLGAVGVYGTINHFVARRRREYGIRIALGLAPGRVVWQVMLRGGAPVAAGIVVGTVGVLVGSRVLEGFLYGVGRADPLALGSAGATLLAAGLAAAFVPAWRASRSDPAGALREQ